MPPRDPSRFRAALALAAVFAIKVIVALQLDAQPLLQPDTGLDTTAYAELAKRVVSGDLALGPGLYYVSPLYIYVLALAYGVAKSFTAARIVQAALGTVGVALIFLTTREWFGRRAAWLAGALAALTGVITYYESLILQASLDIVLTSLALWLLTLALRRERARLFVFAGIAFGVGSLNRPNAIVAAVAIVMLLLVLRRTRASVLLLAGVLAGLAPVTVRNVVVAHQWSLVSSHGGINFYIGNAEGATGYFHAVPGMRSTIEGLALDARRVAAESLHRNVSDGEASAYFSSLTWSWIRAHPAAWTRLLLWKAYGVFNAAHVSIPFSYTFYEYDAGTLLRVLFVGPWLLIPLGVFGLVRAMPRPWPGAYVLWLAFVPTYAASVVLFFITERYKLPLYAPLAIGAGAALDWLWTRRRTREAFIGIAAIAMLAVAANWPLHLDDGRSDERIRMAEDRAAHGDVEAAERWTSLALTDAPDRAAVQYRVGAQLINGGRATAAIAHLEEANRLRAGDAMTEYLLGRALLATGRAADAAPYLQRAIAHRVDAPLAGYDLAVALQQSGDVAGATRALRAIVPPSGASVDVWLQLGKRAGELGAADLAETFFRRAMAIAPDHARAHHLLALALLVQKRYGDAAAELTRVLQLDPGNADARAALAYCEQRLRAK
jgi:tetratricopeptide (TPR) repeat protein